MAKEPKTSKPVEPVKPVGPVITKEKMQKFENVRQSGITNMFDLTNVMNLSRLTSEECKEIIKNYDKYVEEFNIDRGC